MEYGINKGAYDSVVTGGGPVSKRSHVGDRLWSLDIVCCDQLRQDTLSVLSQFTKVKWVHAYAGGLPALDWRPIGGDTTSQEGDLNIL